MNVQQEDRDLEAPHGRMWRGEEEQMRQGKLLHEMN